MSGFQVPLGSIREALRGVIPSAIATCSPDGVPNITYLSMVLYLDEERIALSNQFMSKTLTNIGENPQVAIRVVDPETLYEYDIDARYVRSEASGELFDSMHAQLEAVAAQTGMEGNFRLRKAVILQAVECRRSRGGDVPFAGEASRVEALSGLDVVLRRLADSRDLAEATRVALESIEDVFGFSHSMLLVADEEAERLFVVATNGYPTSGIGAEVAMDEGAIGVAARRRQPVRITSMARGRTLAAVQQENSTEPTEIPLPGLADAQSVLVTPMVVQGRLVGVLYLDDTRPGRFDHDAGQIVDLIAGHLGVTIALLEAGGLDPVAGLPDAPPVARSNVRRTVAFYERDGTVLVDGDYVIKGVPGRILFSLLTEHEASGRTEFTNKEIRLNRAVGLPVGNDNLEARLLTLRRRLAERNDPFRLERIGRGRLKLAVDAPCTLDYHDVDFG